MHWKGKDRSVKVVAILGSDFTDIMPVEPTIIEHNLK